MRASNVRAPINVYRVVMLSWALLPGCATTGHAAQGVQADAATAPKADFYVSPKGNDVWSGRLPTPSADGKDGPFATIARAQQAIRDTADEPALPGRRLVLIRGGRYVLDKPIAFTPQDSGSDARPVVYQAYGDERPVFSGGVAITGWQRGQGSVWTAQVPKVGGKPITFNQLFVNGKRATRARHPNEGYLRTDGPLPGLKNYRDRKKVENKMGFRYKAGDLKRWERLEDVVLSIYHSWTNSLNWISKLDTDKRTVHFVSRTGWPIGYWEKRQRYYVENALELLDAPGEWYLNRQTGVVSYRPRSGEDMAKASVVAPRLRKLVVFSGHMKVGQPVTHIELVGLTFEHATWFVKDRGPADGQAAAWLEAAVFARGAHHCLLEGCTVRHVGEYGIYLERGCTNNRVVQCHVHDLGAGGVRLGYMSGEKDPKTASHHNTVHNCFIHDGGHVFRAGVGAWIGRSSHNRLSHNEICDFDYTGISVGWCWGYAKPSSAHHNIIEYNRVHHIGNGVLSDMGGIYTLGVSPGTIIRNNVFHTIFAYAYGGWGLYTDEGSSEIVMENNLVYDTKTGGFHQHYGRENVIHNNILAFSRYGQIQRSRDEPHISFIFKNNIVYFDNGMLLSGRWKNGHWKMDGNCYWDTSGKPIEFAWHTFDEWQARGFGRHSIIADPKFVNPAKRDFRLRGDSPAYALGFRRFNVDQAGLTGDARWRAMPQGVTHREIERPMQKLATHLTGPKYVRLDGKPMTNWAQPPKPVDAAFRHIDVGYGGKPITYKARVSKGDAFVVVFGLCEGFWKEKGKRVLDLKIDGKTVATVDPIAAKGQNVPLALAFSAEDADQDGKLTIQSVADTGSSDKNSILNVIWVLPGDTPCTDEVLTALVRGQYKGKVLLRIDCGK